MAKTIEQLKAQGAEVKNATVVGENTATRVGTLFTDIVEHVEQNEAEQTADTEANALAISNEAQARAKADEGLNNAIVAEKNRATAAEQHLRESVYSVKEETLEENRKMVNSVLENYAPVEITGNVNNAADEEDLTSVNVEGTDVLKFKDKAYNPLTYSGMGRKILRKNIISGVNTLTQSMINQANTIYVIQYDFTLGEEITIPANCVLKFYGGSISGAYTIIGQNTGIEAGLIKIFDISVITKGRWAVDEYHPEWFGAVTDDDTIDCTNAINKAIIMSGNSYGGVVKFVQGIYNFIGPININHKTSLIGSGIGTSILMQMPNSNNHGIYVGLNYSGLRFSNFSIRGRRDNTKSGIYFVDRVGEASGQTDTEQKQYAYSEYNDENYSYYPGYKYTIIDNIYIGGFNWGLYLGQGLFDVIVTHCTISENLDRGVIFMASDCEMTDCYINNNGSSGLYVNNGPNKFSNLKVIFNALTKSNVALSAGIYLDAGATGEFFANCETQDNMCKGWHITGINNRFVNCMSETDGHIDDASHGYQSGYNIYGFYINERIKIGTISETKIYRDFVKTNVFTNCLVTHRGGITKYDAPVKMIVPYPDIYEGIRIKVQEEIADNSIVGTHLFVNPQYIPDYSRLSHNIGNIAATTIDEINYFNMTSATKIRQRIVTSDEMYIYIAMRFDTTRAGQYLQFTQALRIDALKTDKGSNIEYRFVYNESSYKLVARTKIGDADFVTLLLKKKGNSLYISAAVKSNDTNDYILYRKDYHDVNNVVEIIDYLETNLCLNKLVITNRPIDPTYIIPGSDLSNFRSDALVYISADSPNTNVTEGSLTSGTFADKPTVANNSIPVGYTYFCTDRQTPECATDGIEIIHKGNNVWVDALGRVIN